MSTTQNLIGLNLCNIDIIDFSDNRENMNQRIASTRSFNVNNSILGGISILILSYFRSLTRQGLITQ